MLGEGGRQNSSGSTVCQFVEAAVRRAIFRALPSSRPSGPTGGIVRVSVWPARRSAALVVVVAMAGVALAHTPHAAHSVHKRAMLAAARKQAASREILLWMTPSEAPKALQASECSELLDPMRASCWISAQH